MNKHYLVVRTDIPLVGYQKLKNKLKRSLTIPYALSGDSGLYRIIVNDDVSLSIVEKRIKKFKGVEVVAINAPYDE
ncbi:MAG: hypothetical protein ABI406_06295 [Ktedonobacteraceae bacterium]